MLPRARDRFDEWLHTPLPNLPEDPRLEASRATLEDFEAIYDLVDVVFGEKRPRALYDWLYRRNPLGPAYCWIVREREGGRIVGTGARWPWPVERGDEPLHGMLVGDNAIAPEWQRRGVSELRRNARLMHPMTASQAVFGWANDNTVAVSVHKGRPAELIGPLREVSLRLRQSAVARLLWRIRRPPADAARIEDVTRFDASFDSLTTATMSWNGYWCPRSAGFLNWRYTDHPTRRYRCLAAVTGDEIAGYTVMRPEGRTALLMELVAPEGSTTARALMTASLTAAREAGCRRIRFHATTRFPHWRLLRELGFAERPGRRHLFNVLEPVPGIPDPDRILVVPGDSDVD